MRHSIFLVCSLAVVCGGFLGGCGDPSATGARLPVGPIEQQAVQPAEDTTGLSEEEIEVLSEARAVLAAHLDLLNVTDAEPVLIRSTLWSDGSLGCPQPGYGYTQAIVNGYKVVLALTGVQHHVHMAVSSYMDRGQVHKQKSYGLVCKQLQDSVLAEDERSGEVPKPNASQIPQSK